MRCANHNTVPMHQVPKLPTAHLGDGLNAEVIFSCVQFCAMSRWHINHFQITLINVGMSLNPTF